MDTSSRYYKFEGKNNRRFCCINWRHVGEHLERNWLSIRRSPCNKRSTCWSVLMCCKKNFLSWVTFWKKTSWVELHFGKNFLSWFTFKKNFELSYILEKKLLELSYILGKKNLSYILGGKTSWVELHFVKKNSWVELHFGKKLLELSYIL